MKYVRILFRVLVIYIILLRYRLDEMLFRSHLSFLAFMIYLNPFHYIQRKSSTPGLRLRKALERLGPIYVKFGQILSTRQDLLPPDMAMELAVLRDQTKPFSSKVAKNIIEESLGYPIAEAFQEFSLKPMASASIAQVHAATLLNGREVVVKVLRPNVNKQIARDLEMLKVFASIVSRILPNGDRLRLKEVVQEFEMSLNAELDLNREAANAGLMRRQFKESNELYIPEIFWDFTRQNILVSERIHGVSIDDLSALRAQGSNLKLLAKQLIEVFFAQVFRNNFFHADMHPGNLFVSRVQKEQIIAVDFGIVGSLTESDRRYIAENLLAFFHRDYQRVAELHIESGWIDSRTRITEFEAAIRTVSEPVFEKPLKDISMGQLILNLFHIARDFQINIQPQLILLQKTLLNVESLARHIDPEMDLWRTAKPFLEKWLSDQMGVRSLLRKVKERMPFWIEKMPDMPELIYAALKNINASTTSENIPASPSKKKARYSIILGIGLSVFTLACLAIKAPQIIIVTSVGLSLMDWFYVLWKK